MTTPGDIARIETIRLSGGWRGKVLTGPVRGPKPASGESQHRTLPDPDHWRAFLQKLITAPDALPDYAVLKFSRGGKVFRATFAIGECSIAVIAKQSRLSGLRKHLSVAFSGTREARNFRRGLTLFASGVSTALPLAWLERRRPRREAWLITEFLDDLVDLDQVALGLLANLPRADRARIGRNVVSAVSDLLAALDDIGLTHRDFKASNVLLRNWGEKHGPVSALLVDLDGISKASQRTRWQPIVRLAASLLAYPAVTRTDYARFLRAYLSAGADGQADWKSHYRRIAAASAGYVQRAHGRKSHKLDGYSGEA